MALDAGGLAARAGSLLFTHSSRRASGTRLNSGVRLQTDMSRMPKKDGIRLTVFFVFMTLFIASFWISFNSFSPEHEYLKLCAAVSVIFGLFAPWLVVRYLMTDIARGTFSARSPPSKITGIFFIASFAAIGCLTILCLGIGYIVTDLIGESTSLISTVDEVSSGRYKRRSCDHYYSVRTFDNRHFKFCTKPRAQHQWHKGEVVNIYVKHSKLGYVAMKSNNSVRSFPSTPAAR
ncbi:hypothetical protein ABXT00_09725 [Stenotrophomonas koreensis]|uniref:hypothetical protein n=1 Tax=Stenotrophomonas koreensis TaxID=266128 RepID=UPI003390A90E